MASFEQERFFVGGIVAPAPSTRDLEHLPALAAFAAWFGRARFGSLRSGSDTARLVQTPTSV